MAYVGCIAGAIPIDDYKAGLAAAGFSAVQVIDSGADLNAYASVEGQSGCCSPSMKEDECCEQPADGSACCDKPAVATLPLVAKVKASLTRKSLSTSDLKEKAGLKELLALRSTTSISSRGFPGRLYSLQCNSSSGVLALALKSFPTWACRLPEYDFAGFQTVNQCDGWRWQYGCGSP